LWGGSEHYKEDPHQKSSQTEQVDKTGLAGFANKLWLVLDVFSRKLSKKNPKIDLNELQKS
jgi:hypothetical protein